ncbi:polyketide biosynthesis 3-hydroxy-3-methylglutaryl-ACP synthase PksG [Mycobacterium stomatepiae]|uniref:Polyketide biosynthesis 3-hydroxy-3-methylglutaryl-ACP synthase PksG n=2 Tax=Mycobacterium stomatepiae TaxID=470076 RepID=A0A7I7Q867_9MYCO|nr:polyketide biosynthesis 3-hydroxy-3-methylglutaryl-ACP synthase PksG [Mycobacterium stomatepiae]
MRRKSVNLPIEDAVTNAVNAAAPIVRAMTDEERETIELVIVGTESGIDFGKALSTYVLDYLNLSRRCRTFETKHACYGGTAALQMASGFIRSSSREVRALVIAADAASVAARSTYWEPSQGAGAVAMLIGREGHILSLDHGANGYHSYEVSDTFRPRPDVEAGDSDLSLMSYMSCLEASFAHYAEVVENADICDTFGGLVLHTPFAGMVKSAHRRLLRRVATMSLEEIDGDFIRRVEPSIRFCQDVGNFYSAALYLAICSYLTYATVVEPQRIGLFSYGSGCSSEFYSGVVTPESAAAVSALRIPEQIADRHELEMDDYEIIADLALERMAGVENSEPDTRPYGHLLNSAIDGKSLLVLESIKNYHRVYRWA